MKRPHGFAPRTVISLRHFQRNPITALGLHGHKWVRIWSDEHRAYWRSGGSGYVVERAGAGVFTCFDAYHRTSGCGPEKKIWFEWHKPDEILALAERIEREAANWKGRRIETGLLSIAAQVREMVRVA
jgi:hypothetical protein